MKFNIVNLVKVFLCTMLPFAVAKTAMRNDFAARYGSLSEKQDSQPNFVAISPAASQPGVFSKFQFKGFPLSFSKPLSDLTSVGVGFKLPITASFPEYDRRYYLPRVVGFLGVNYPYHWKLAFTITVPVQVLLILALYATRVKKDLEFAPLNPKNGPKRVGVSISYKYTEQKGVEPSFGPILNYVANPFITNTLVPLALFAPVLVLSAVETFAGAIFAVLFVLYYLLDHTVLELGRILAPKVTPSKEEGQCASIEQRLSNLLYVKSSWKKMSNWMATKVPVFGYTLGYISTPKNTFKLGSSVNFDIQSFNPLAKLFANKSA